MKEHRFTVILANLPEMTDDASNALYEAGCDDGSPGSCDGVSRVDFDREAANLEEAIRTAVADIRKAGFETERIEIERDDLEELLRAPASANV